MAESIPAGVKLISGFLGISGTIATIAEVSRIFAPSRLLIYSPAFQNFAANTLPASIVSSVGVIVPSLIVLTGLVSVYSSYNLFKLNIRGWKTGVGIFSILSLVSLTGVLLTIYGLITSGSIGRGLSLIVSNSINLAVNLGVTYYLYNRRELFS